MSVSIAVQGASGGLGCSSLVAAVAVRAAQSGRTAVCLDHRWSGGGLDVVLGVEQRPGLRWPDLRRARGALDGHELLAALPGRRGVRVLSCGREHPGSVPPEALDAARQALDRAADVVVHDLPSPESPAWADAVAGHDLVCLLSGALAHQVSAASAVLALLPAESAPVLAVRAPDRDGAAAVADLLGLPLLAPVPDDRSVTADLTRAVAPGTARGTLRDLADRVLARAVTLEAAA